MNYLLKQACSSADYTALCSARYQTGRPSKQPLIPGSSLGFSFHKPTVHIALPGISAARYKASLLQLTPGTVLVPVSIFANASRRSRVGAWRTVYERGYMPACFSVTYREWQDSSSHTKGLMAFVAAAWPTLNRWLQQGEKQRQGLGAPPSEATPPFYRYLFSFAACYFCFSSFPQVILLHGAQG